MRERDWKRIGWFTSAICWAFIAIIGVVAVANETAAPVRNDAKELAPKVVQLSEIAVDPFYSIPTPAPSVELGPSAVPYDSFTTVLGKLQACDARLCQHLDDCAWRTPIGVER